jgi:cobalt/nickel transport system ATP-binding protein
MMASLMETADLRYAYPGAAAAASICPGQRAQALAGASLAVRAGTRLALLGGNGSGKSTLLLQLNGTLRPTSGEVRFAGAKLDYSRRGLTKLRQHVALVFQDPDDQLFAGTLAQDVSFGPLNLGLNEAEAARRVAEALDAVGLAEFGDLPLHMLSHGQRKRAAIAGGLALRPLALVLDEPTAGLDPEGVEALLAHLDGLHAQGMTVVFSTHDIQLARCWADEVAIMQAGCIIGFGDTAAMLADEDLLRRARLCPTRATARHRDTALPAGIIQR